MRSIFFFIFLSWINFCFFQRVKAQGFLSEKNYKHQTVLGVLEEISSTYNELKPVPNLKMAKGKSETIAEYSSERGPTISFDEKLYDICRTFGEDSLDCIALIIGHELAHYHQNHQFWYGFAGNKKGNNKLIDMGVETQADELGVFHALAAGYNSFEVAEELINKIYLVYKLPESIKGEKPKSQRITGLKNKIADAKLLGIKYEIGNFLSLKNHFNQAAQLYENVLFGVPSKDVLNNIAFNKIQEALKMSNSADMPFRLPIELELSNRLNPEEMRSDNIKIVQIKLLEDAIKSCQQAIEIEPKYEAAHLNMICANLILGRTGTSLDLVDGLEKMIGATANINLIKGIIYALKKEKELASKYFKRADGAFEIEYNRLAFGALVEFQKSNNKAKIHDFVTKNNRKIDSNNKPESVLGAFNLPIKNLSLFSKTYNSVGSFVTKYMYQLNKQQLIAKAEIDKHKYDFVRIKQKGIKTQKGIENGNTVNSVVENYGNPTKKVATAKGEWLLYDSANLIFQIEKKKVVSIIVFSDSKSD
jgi:tetratricopeptide (TPR) repeat protein